MAALQPGLSSRCSQRHPCRFSPTASPSHQAVRVPTWTLDACNAYSLGTSQQQQAQGAQQRQQAKTNKYQRSDRLVCCASAGEATKKKTTIPLFPLNIVAIPYCSVPLNIFEARYRVLFSTLLDGAKGVEEGLVQKDSPFCGTRKFGMCFVEPTTGALATMGTVLQIEEHEHLSDGRIVIFSKGVQRFKITDIVRKKPILIAEVELQEDELGDPVEAKELSAEVADLMRNVILLNIKMANKDLPDDLKEPEHLAEYENDPVKLSFYVAGFFQDVRVLQQSLLEEDSAVDRLKKEKTVLEDTVKYFSALAAVKSAFSGSTSEKE